MKSYDIIVVGASFGGLSCATVAAQRGLRVAILERKKDLKKSIHTTGILVQEATEVIHAPESLVNKINKVRLYSPSLKYIELSSKEYSFYATDTPELLSYLAEKARDAGADIYLGCSFNNAKEDGNEYIINNSFRCKFLVGADGARSSVAAYFNLGKNTKFLLGSEAEFSGVELDSDDKFYCFIDQTVAKGYIGWVIPGVGITQVGVAATMPAKPNLKAFWQKISPLLTLNNPKIVNRRGGLIPVGGVVEPFFKENIILVGDAAGIVSPLTGGGIHTAAYFGERVANLIADYMLNKSAHPSVYLKDEYPQFYIKQLFRKVHNMLPNNIFNILFNLPTTEYIANKFFFLRKKLKMKKASTK